MSNQQPVPTPARRGLVQAPIDPVDDSGVRAAVVGTVLFAVASVVLATQLNDLSNTGRGWYLGVALAGMALGLVGIAWTMRRSRRRSGTPAQDTSTPAQEKSD